MRRLGSKRLWTRTHPGVTRQSSGGFAMIMSLLFIILIASVVTVGLHNTGLSTRITRNLQQGMQARYLAEAGIGHAVVQLSRDPEWRDGVGTTAMGEGTYSVAVNQPTICDPITLTAIGMAAGAQRTITEIIPPSGYPFQTGTYTGDGQDNRAITGVGFQPDVVLIKAAINQRAVGRTATMSGNVTKALNATTALEVDWIKSIDADGFTVGTRHAVNKNNMDFYWMAWQAVSGTVAVGMYMGNGLDNRLIDISDTSTSTDFQPTYVMVLPAGTEFAGHRSAEMGVNQSFPLDTGGAWTNTIQDVTASGFVVGNDDRINKSGDDYHYIAWRAVLGHIETGTYVGNGVDSRDVDPLCFPPEYVIVKADDIDGSVHRPASLGAIVDETLEFGGAASASNWIQDLHIGGFEVGTHARVNSNGKTYFWVAFH